MQKIVFWPNKMQTKIKKISGPRPRNDKSLGQHYLIDQKIISQIIHNHQDLYQYILEVGPGPAVLTKGLSLLNKSLHVFEMDKRFKPSLLELLPDDNIIMGDALKIDFSDFIKKYNLSGHGLIVSNLPYNISVPLFIKFLEAPEIKYLTLMFQKEVAEKIHPLNGPKENDMGSLKALAQTYFETQKLITVPPGAFSPPPQVNSTVISFVRRDLPKVPFYEWKNFESFCRRLFAHRRKQAQKVLKSFYSPESIDQAFLQCHIKKMDRAESFDLNQVHALYQCLANKNTNEDL